MPCNYKNYHPKWKLISYQIRVKRANNFCEWCGAENYSPHPITGKRVILSTAHIDHNKKNNRFINLAALCQKCHLGHDRWFHAANRKLNLPVKTRQVTLTFHDMSGLNFKHPLLPQLLDRIK